MSSMDKLEEINSCLRAVSELLCPDGNFDGHSRDDLAMLLDYLRREQEAVIRAMYPPKQP